MVHVGVGDLDDDVAGGLELGYSPRVRLPVDERAVVELALHLEQDARAPDAEVDPPRPLLVVTDVDMPRLNGKQCLVELKKEAHLRDIPVIIYSTSSEKRDIDETARLGAAHFLTKPNKFEELCKAISYVASKDWDS